MQGPEAKRIATRESWEVRPLPEARAELGFAESYTNEEFELIKRGLIPEEMEHKWFIFFEEPWLHFHRSWTGHGIYGVKFKTSPGSASVIDSWVSREDTWKGTKTKYDRLLLKFLIDALLLGRPAKFPLPYGIPAEGSIGPYQHHISGANYQKVVPAADQALTPSSHWVRILNWLKMAVR